jgi:UrcA family protein
MNTATRIIFASLVTFASVVSSARAHADSAPVLGKTVIYDARSLNSEQGARTLYARIRAAASEVCSVYDSPELSRKRIWQSCMDIAVESAVLKVNSPLVSAVHNKAALKATAG